MLFVTEYRIKSSVTREDTRRLMDLFAKEPTSPGELAHYVRMDGAGGYVLIDSDDTTALSRASSCSRTSWSSRSSRS